MVPSSCFLLAVEPISASGVESTATRFIKRWLNLPRNATQAILFHPTILNCPHLKSEKVKAKISQLAALYSTTDKMIHEIHFELSNPNFMKSLHIPKEAVDLIHLSPTSLKPNICPNILVLSLNRLLLNTGTHTYQLFLFKINFQNPLFWNKNVRFGKELWMVCQLTNYLSFYGQLPIHCQPL